MIASMVGRSIEQLYPEHTSVPSTEALLEVRQLSQSGIVHDISFCLHRGEVLGVFGLMGSGRTELARLIFGMEPYEAGEILVEGVPLRADSPTDCIRQKMAFVTENRREEGLLMDMSIAENIGLVALPAYADGRSRLLDQRKLYQAAGEVGRSLQLKSASIEQQPVKSLSGGNQQKAVLGKWLLSRPEVFILDEPTRGVDVGAKYEIYSIVNDLATQGAGVLVISSELEELIGICDRILVMSNGEIQGAFSQAAFDKESILRAAFREQLS